MGRIINKIGRYSKATYRAKQWACSALIIALASCADTSRSAEAFKQDYWQLNQNEQQQVVPKEEKPITLSVSGLDMSAFVRRLVDLTGASVVIQTKYDSEKVTGEFRGQSIDKILTVVARRIGCELSKIGTVYYLGDLKSEDKAVLVKKVRRLAIAKIGDVITAVLSESGKLTVTDDGILVVTDRIQVINRISDLVDQVESTPASCWITQIWMMTLGKSTTAALGFDTTTALNISLTFQKAASALIATDAFSAMLHTVFNSNDSKMVAEPMMLLIDGNTGEWHSGETVPVAQQTVSNQGTVSTTGYTNISTGLDAKITLREQNSHQARLDVNISQSTISGYVDNSVPVIDSNSLNTELVVENGGTYLAGLLTVKSANKGWAQLVRNDVVNDEEMQIWIRAYPIVGAARTAVITADP